jgi:hypothetical protein
MSHEPRTNVINGLACWNMRNDFHGSPSVILSEVEILR